MQTDFRPRNIERVISTLDPGRVQSSDALTLNEGQQILRISLGNNINVDLGLPWFPLGHPLRQHLNSSGFLYYHTPNVPETAGELRIRLTPSPDASTFNQGRDLQNVRGRVWNIPLIKLASYPQLDPLCQKLLQDQLVTPSLISYCKKLTPNYKTKLASLPS